MKPVAIRNHVIGLILCGLLVGAFEYVAIMWSLADFHPGYTPDLPEYLYHRARIGSAMRLPFDGPLHWLRYNTDGHFTFVCVVQWLILPLCYGAVLYFAFVFLRQRFFSTSRR